MFLRQSTIPLSVSLHVPQSEFLPPPVSVCTLRRSALEAADAIRPLRLLVWDAARPPEWPTRPHNDCGCLIWPAGMALAGTDGGGGEGEGVPTLWRSLCTLVNSG